MPVIRIEGFKDDKGGLWVSNFPLVISGARLSRANCTLSFSTHLTLLRVRTSKTQKSLLAVEICKLIKCKENTREVKGNFKRYGLSFNSDLGMQNH